MNMIDTRIVLDAGAQNIHNNHPDALVRRTTLASLLVTARAVKSIDAGLLSFRMWSSPQTREHDPSFVFLAANTRVAESS